MQDEKVITLRRTINLNWIENYGNDIVGGKDKITLNFSEVRKFDSAGAAFIKLCANNPKIKMINYNDEIYQIINEKPLTDEIEIIPASSEDIFEKTGTGVVNMFDEFTKALVVLVEMVYWGTLGLFKKRDFRKGVLGEQMYHLGYGAISITTVLTFLIGVAIATQSAIQLKQFGADVFLVMLVVMGMVREMGPLMAAIILAGRTGSATTAEIATMKVQEEVDAIKTMGLNEIQFIVVPKFWALSITMPLLSVLATLSGIAGGLCVAYFYSGLSLDIIWDNFKQSIVLKDFIISFIKSLIFAWLILWIGAYYGFGVRGGAEEVGKATTKSVVTAIFIIVITDALFSFVY